MNAVNKIDATQNAKAACRMPIILPHWSRKTSLSCTISESLIGWQTASTRKNRIDAINSRIATVIKSANLAALITSVEVIRPVKILTDAETAIVNRIVSAVFDRANFNAINRLIIYSSIQIG
jgi:hypothetical protein